LLGFAGDDILDGGSGNDTMMGGTGNDYYIVASSYDQVVESANAGHDMVNLYDSMTSYTLADNVEDLSVVMSGTYNLTGNTLNNNIQGGAGNDCGSGGIRQWSE
jgi:Ca2+-binding RTX toxin-like protein